MSDEEFKARMKAQRKAARQSHRTFMRRMEALNAYLDEIAERTQDQAERLKAERLEREAVEPFVTVDDWAWVDFLADHPELWGDSDA